MTKFDPADTERGKHELFETARMHYDVEQDAN